MAAIFMHSAMEWLYTASKLAFGVLRDRIQGARFAVIQGGYHLCNVEKPHAFNEAVLGFLLEGDAD